MAKSAPTKNQHAFAAWVTSKVPKHVWVKITATRAYVRRNGFRSEEFSMRIALDLYGKKIEQTSDDLEALARWLTTTALPFLFPSVPHRGPAIANAPQPKPMPAKVAG